MVLYLQFFFNIIVTIMLAYLSISSVEIIGVRFIVKFTLIAMAIVGIYLIFSSLDSIGTQGYRYLFLK